MLVDKNLGIVKKIIKERMDYQMKGNEKQVMKDIEIGKEDVELRKKLIEN